MPFNKSCRISVSLINVRSGHAPSVKNVYSRAGEDAQCLWLQANWLVFIDRWNSDKLKDVCQAAHSVGAPTKAEEIDAITGLPQPNYSNITVNNFLCEPCSHRLLEPFPNSS